MDIHRYKFLKKNLLPSSRIYVLKILSILKKKKIYKPKICIYIYIYLTRKKRCGWHTFRRVIIGDKEVSEVLGMKIDSTWEGTHGHSSACHACTPRSLAFSPLNGPTCLLRLFWVCNQGVNGSFGRFSIPYHFDEYQCHQYTWSMSAEFCFNLL